MKKLTSIILTQIVLAVLILLIFSFVKASFNIMQWGEGARFGIALIFSCTLAFNIIAHQDK